MLDTVGQNYIIIKKYLMTKECCLSLKRNENTLEQCITNHVQ
jgi:hypothetical protein